MTWTVDSSTPAMLWRRSPRPQGRAHRRQTSGNRPTREEFADSVCEFGGVVERAACITKSRVPGRILEKRAMTIPARYENGVFRPLQDVPIKEGTVVEVHLPLDAPAKRPRSIGDSPFAGMWKDREDMADSVEFIDRIRRELHG